jgi:hypothetical protein
MLIYNNYIAIFILSVIFFIISGQKINILLAIIIIMIIGYYYYKNIQEYDDKNITNDKNKIISINKDIKYRKYINDDLYYLKKFPEKVKYLYRDKTLMDIILNIRFMKRYDSEKYTNILMYMDKFYKIYMFILANRYDIKQYFSTFISLRDTILRELYRIYVILPIKMKYYYGFDSFTEIKKTITEFTIYSRKMITILERYGYQEKQVFYLNDTKYKSYDNNIHDVL